MTYLNVYKELMVIAEQAKMDLLAPVNFVIQDDAYQRIADEDNADELFLRYTYEAGQRDDDLPFVLVMTREGFGFGSDNLSVGAGYADFKTSQAAAQAIFDTCVMFLNGQIRVVASVRGSTIKYLEQFIVVGSDQEPLQLFVPRSSMLFGRRAKHLEAHVLRNNVLKQQIMLDTIAYLRNDPLRKAYLSISRAIVWDDPTPLGSRELNKIMDELSWDETGKPPLQHPYVYALKQWETWAFTVIFGAVFVTLGLLLPQFQNVIRVVSQVSFVVFVIYYLPDIARRKYAKRNTDSQ